MDKKTCINCRHFIVENGKDYCKMFRKYMTNMSIERPCFYPKEEAKKDKKEN